jgi:hypothetical protein
MERESVVFSDPKSWGARPGSAEHVFPSTRSSTISKPAIPWTNSWTTFLRLAEKPRFGRWKKRKHSSPTRGEGSHR